VAEDQWETELAANNLAVQNNPVAAYQLFIPRQTLSHIVRKQSGEFCRNMLQGLQGTGIICQEINQERIRRYLDYFVRTGFLPPAARDH
jgi:hypothetical protein